MKESNNQLKVLLRNTDSDTEAKGTTTQQHAQIPWSANVISNLESGINTERLIAVANNPSLESLERGKPQDLRDPRSYKIFTIREFKSAFEKNNKRSKILKLKGRPISQKAQLE